MKKFLILIATILISATAVSAQTNTKGDRRRSAERVKSVTSINRRERSRVSLVLKLGPSTTYIKNGLSYTEVVRFLGRPSSVSERQDGQLRLTTLTFTRSQGRVLVTEFADGVLINSRMETNESLSQNRALEQ
jgi:hypothetical protein